MDTNIESSTLSQADRELANNLTGTLNKSLLDIDKSTRLELERARASSLAMPIDSRYTKRTRIGAWMSLAAAASFAAIMIFPSGQLPSSKDLTSDEMTYLSVDPEWLEDMEMLEAFEGFYDDAQDV